MAIDILEFEKPLKELERQISELEKSSREKRIDLTADINELKMTLAAKRKELYENLTPWQKVQIARHPKRPYMLDFVNLIMQDLNDV